MRKWFTAQELAGLPGLPGTVQGVNLRAKREGWEAQLRLGRGGGQEYCLAVLPAEAQTALLARLVSDEAPQAAPIEAKEIVLRDAISASRLTDDQRNVMTARVAIIREIERMSQMTSQQRAIMTLVGLARDGQLSPYLQGRVQVANDRLSDDRTLSERTLKDGLKKTS